MQDYERPGEMLYQRLFLDFIQLLKHHDEMIAIRMLLAEKKSLGIEHANILTLLLRHCMINDSVDSQKLKLKCLENEDLAEDVCFKSA